MTGFNPIIPRRNRGLVFPSNHKHIFLIQKSFQSSKPYGLLRLGYVNSSESSSHQLTEDVVNIYSIVNEEI